MLQELLAQNPGLEVTPQILLGFIAEKTKSTTPPQDEERGREEHRRDVHYGHSRSLSSDSDGTSYHPGNQSRPPSRGPMTPSFKSPLDSERRQRSTPLSTAPPSSWTKRPTPAGRRKSDAGSRSDGEVRYMCFLHAQNTLLNHTRMEHLHGAAALPDDVHLQTPLRRHRHPKNCHFLPALQVITPDQCPAPILVTRIAVEVEASAAPTLSTWAILPQKIPSSLAQCHAMDSTTWTLLSLMRFQHYPCPAQKMILTKKSSTQIWCTIVRQQVRQFLWKSMSA